jgi:hypothetical protein
MGKIIIDDEKVRILEEAVMAYFKVLSWHPIAGIKETHKTSVRTASDLANSNPGTFWIQAYGIIDTQTHSTDTLSVTSFNSWVLCWKWLNLVSENT